MPSRDLKVTLLGEDRTGPAFSSAAGNADGLLAKFAKFGAVAAAAAGTGLGAFAVTSAQAGMAFQATLNQMAAVADVPKAALADLSSLALKMGADTKFSAQEAADSMLNLAKGGLTAAQIQGGALESTLTLAAAGGLDLAAAAGYMSNALNAFGLQAKDAGVVAAALAGGSNASTASVESLGLALGQVGMGAVDAGLSLQQTVAVLAAFDNAGVKGSDAGTSLKTMLSRLVPTTKEAAKEMRSLGLDFTDAQGRILPISEIAGQLQRQLGKLSQEQRSVALTTIFGSDATRAASVLMKEGSAGLDAYIQKTSDLTAAQRVAKATMSGAAGAVEQMRGSFQTLATTIGLQMNPYVESAALRMTDLLNQLTSFIPSVTSSIGAAGNFGATFARVGEQMRVHLGNLRQTFAVVMEFVRVNVLPVLVAVGEFILTRVVPTVVTLSGHLMAGLRTAFETISRKIEENRPQLETLLQGFRQVADFVVTKVIPLLGPVWQATFTTMGVAIGAVIDGIGLLVSTFSWLQRTTGEMVNFVAVQFRGLLSVWLTVAGGIVSGAAAALSWVPGVGDKLKVAENAFDALRTGILGKLDNVASSARGWGEQTGNLFAQGIRATTAEASAAAAGMAAAVSRKLRQMSPAKEGPLSEGGGTFGWGAAAAALYAAGIDSKKGSIASASSAAAGAVGFGGLGVPGAASSPLGGARGDVVTRLHPDDIRSLAWALTDLQVTTVLDGRKVGQSVRRDLAWST